MYYTQHSATVLASRSPHIICIIMTSSSSSVLSERKSNKHTSTVCSIHLHSGVIWFWFESKLRQTESSDSLPQSIRTQRSAPRTQTSVPGVSQSVESPGENTERQCHIISKYTARRSASTPRVRHRLLSCVLTSNFLRTRRGENGSGRTAQHRFQALDVVPTRANDLRLRTDRHEQR